MNNTEDQFVELLRYISKNMETEPLYINPINPQTSVEVKGLLDKIAELRGITKDQNGLEFNQICDDNNKITF